MVCERMDFAFKIKMYSDIDSSGRQLIHYFQVHSGWTVVHELVYCVLLRKRCFRSYRFMIIECLFCTLQMFSVILDVIKIGYPIDKCFHKK